MRIRIRVYSVLGSSNNRFEYTDDDEMIGAAGIIIDDSENVYVCEKGGDCIHVLSKSGDFIRRINFGRNPIATLYFETKRTSALFVAGDMSTILQTFILNGSFTFY